LELGGEERVGMVYIWADVPRRGLSIKRLYLIHGADESDSKTSFCCCEHAKDFHIISLKETEGNGEEIVTIIVYIESQLPP
jgi:hypothetical protein